MLVPARGFQRNALNPILITWHVTYDKSLECLFIKQSDLSLIYPSPTEDVWFCFWKKLMFQAIYAVYFLFESYMNIKDWFVLIASVILDERKNRHYKSRYYFQPFRKIYTGKFIYYNAVLKYEKWRSILPRNSKMFNRTRIFLWLSYFWKTNSFDFKDFCSFPSRDV